MVYCMHRWDVSVQADKEKLVQDVTEKVNAMNISIEKAIEVLRERADDLDHTYKKCKVGPAIGRFPGIIGGCLAIGGGVAAVNADEIAALLLTASTAFGVTGALTNIGTSAMEAYNASSVLKEADRFVADASNVINEVKQMIDLLKSDAKNQDRLVFLAVHLIKNFGVNHFILSLIEDSLPPVLLYKIPVAHAKQAAVELFLKASVGGIMAVVSSGARAADIGVQVVANATGDIGVTMAKAAVDVGSKVAARTSRNVGSRLAARAAEDVSAIVKVMTAGDFGSRMAARATEDIGSKVAARAARDFGSVMEVMSAGDGIGPIMTARAAGDFGSVMTGAATGDGIGHSFTAVGAVDGIGSIMTSRPAGVYG